MKSMGGLWRAVRWRMRSGSGRAKQEQFANASGFLPSTTSAGLCRAATRAGAEPAIGALQLQLVHVAGQRVGGHVRVDQRHVEGAVAQDVFRATMLPPDSMNSDAKV